MSDYFECTKVGVDFLEHTRNVFVAEKFIEDYRVTDLGNGTCRVQWYMAMEPRGFSQHLMVITRPIMRVANRYLFRKFKEYAEAYAQGAKVLAGTVSQQRPAG